MTDTMKAVDIKGGKGGRDDLFINESSPKPTAGEGQAMVKIKAFGINQMDILQRKGMYPLPPQAPATLGVEFSGVIESLGGGDHGAFKTGDAVFGLAYGGAYAEFIAVSTKMLLHKPDALSFEQCAAVPETWITATQALHLVLGFVAGKSILWHAGASGVSIAGTQLSRAAGASAVYATAGTEEKCEFIRTRLGATAFNYKTQDWAAEIQRATGGKGVDFIVDFVGADYFNKNLDAAAMDCRIILLGVMSGAVVPQANIANILRKRVRIEGSTLRSRDPDYQGKLRDKLEKDYLPKMVSGELEIIMDQALPWEKVQDAHKHLEESKATGKVVCTIS